MFLQVKLNNSKKGECAGNNKNVIGNFSPNTEYIGQIDYILGSTVSYKFEIPVATLLVDMVRDSKRHS